MPWLYYNPKVIYLTAVVHSDFATTAGKNPAEPSRVFVKPENPDFKKGV